MRDVSYVPWSVWTFAADASEWEYRSVLRSVWGYWTGKKKHDLPLDSTASVRMKTQVTEQSQCLKKLANKTKSLANKTVEDLGHIYRRQRNMKYLLKSCIYWSMVWVYTFILTLILYCQIMSNKHCIHLFICVFRVVDSSGRHDFVTMTFFQETNVFSHLLNYIISVHTFLNVI